MANMYRLEPAVASMSSLRKSKAANPTPNRNPLSFSRTLRQNLVKLQEDTLADARHLENAIVSISEENHRLRRLLGPEAIDPNLKWEFQEGEVVEYLDNENGWMEAVVEKRNYTDSTYVLDKHPCAIPQKIRSAGRDRLPSAAQVDAAHSKGIAAKELMAQPQLKHRDRNSGIVSTNVSSSSLVVGSVASSNLSIGSAEVVNLPRQTSAPVISTVPSTLGRVSEESLKEENRAKEVDTVLGEAKFKQPIHDDLESPDDDLADPPRLSISAAVTFLPPPDNMEDEDKLKETRTESRFSAVSEARTAASSSINKFCKDGGSMLLFDMSGFTSEVSKRSMHASVSSQQSMGERLSMRKRRSWMVVEYRLWPAWTKYDYVASSFDSSTNVDSNGSGARSSSLTGHKISQSHSQTLMASNRSEEKFHGFLAQLEERDRQFSSCVISPLSKFSATWDALFMILILYDFVVVPIDQAFSPESNIFLTVMSWVTRIFWTMSFPLNFFVGFIHPDGTIEERHSAVIRRYLMTWFAFDVLIISADWLEAILEYIDEFGSIGFISPLRILKVVRVLRMFRVCKLPAIVEIMSTRSYFETARLVMNLLKIFGALMGLVHCLACIWFAIGKKDWWVPWTGTGIEATVRYKYGLSLHWAISQVLGNIDIYPKTEGERYFAAASQALCFFVSALFLSEITASLTRLTIISGHIGRQFAILHQYLDYNNISSNLAIRVTRSARYQSNLQERNMPESDVELLALISGPLLAEIHYEVHIPILTSHPFFRRYHHVCLFAARKLCHEATHLFHISPGDLLFAEGERSGIPKMFFLTAGTMIYLKSGIEEFEEVTAGQWACEMACWVPWLHMGDFRAATHVHLMHLDVDTFQRIASEWREPVFYPGEYAKAMVAAVNADNQAAIQSLDLMLNHPECDDISYGNVTVQAIVNKVFPHHLLTHHSGVSSRSSINSLSDALQWVRGSFSSHPENGRSDYEPSASSSRASPSHRDSYGIQSETPSEPA